VLAAPDAVFGLPEWAGRLVLVGIVILATALALWAIRWGVPRLLRRTAARAPERRQRATAIAALATSLRYVVLILAGIAIAFALAGKSGVAAISGTAILVVVIGFASQRLLTDVIAGFFILFEDQYGVGDTVRLEPSGYTGEVEELSLRTTVLLGRRGERMIVPNGQITAVRSIPGGTRHYRLELLTADPDAVSAIVLELASSVAGAGGPWDGAPRIVRRDAGGELTRLVVVLDVAADREVAAQSWLPDAVGARAGDLLAAPPLSLVD
jgi:small-conductance mechanosensitive channel